VTVYLVGAGPGDPGLLTARALELLSVADVVVHDRLVDARVLGFARHGSLLLDVGKRAGGDAAAAQQEINALLVEHGRGGALVVRLKGGDPYVLGRGGEEALALEAAGVPYEVVPGVSALAAVPAYAGVPLTQRGLSSSVVVVTGHDPTGEAGVEVDWDAIGRSAATVVVMMGVARRAEIAASLMRAGRAGSTPVLVVERGTTPMQHSARTTLEGLGALEVESPATIVVGAVAGLHLSAFEDRRLFGRRVVVTRPHHQAGPLVRALWAEGASAVEMATIEIAEAADGGRALAGAAARLGAFEWVVFSSENGVERLFAELRDARAFGAARVAAIGPGTAAALAAHGVVADLVPERFVAEGLLEVFPSRDAVARPGSGKVLLARAALARDVLPKGLGRLGWQVEVVEAYRAVRPEPSPELLGEVASADAVTFTSSSTVTGFLEMAGRDRLPPVIASIGPVTSATARAAGLEVTVEAREHTVGGLVEALAAHAASLRP